MKYHIVRNISLIVASLASSILISAENFTLTDGTEINGQIQKALGEDVTIVTSTGSKSTHNISAFDADGQKSIAAWRAANPQKADVYTKWDTQPVIVSSKMPQLPEQFRENSFKGMASIELILDESGQVMHASVNKSTHDELKAPSIEATKSWKFQPAMIDGQPVKSKLRVPFNFSNTAPAPSYMEVIAPYTQRTAFTL